MNCMVIKYLPIMFTKFMHKYTIFGCQDEIINNKFQLQHQHQFQPPIVQKMDRI
jgi:hypothetical protein